MLTERCAKLMVVGMANNLDEVWITENPTLPMLYMNQYLPNLYRWYVLLNVCFYEETITFILLLFTRPNTKSAFSQHAFCRLQIDSSLRARSRWSTSWRLARNQAANPWDESFCPLPVRATQRWVCQQAKMRIVWTLLALNFIAHWFTVQHLMDLRGCLCKTANSISHQNQFCF